MGYLINNIKKLNNLCTESVIRFGAQYDAFSVFILVFYLANPFKWQSNGWSSAITYLRLTAVVLWIMLVFWRKWPHRLKEYLPLFWYISLCYHLSFRTAFNTLYSDSPSYDSSRLVGIVALAVLVDSKEFCIITLIGTFLIAFI